MYTQLTHVLVSLRAWSLKENNLFAVLEGETQYSPTLLLHPHEGSV